MAWYNTAWGHRVKVTVAHGKVTADQTTFPVYVNLADLPAGFWSNVLNGGGDIRITKADGTTELAREVVTCNTSNSTGELHFNGDSLSSTVDTDFYIYYANASASEPAANATFGKYNTWDSNYKGVYHLQASSVDSTSNQINGTDTSMTYGAGKLGNGGIFSGSGWIDLGINDLITTNISLEAWTKITNFSAYRGIWGRTNSGVPASFDFRSEITTGVQQCGRGDGAGNSFINGTTALTSGTFQHIAYTGAGSAWNLYLNGAGNGSSTNGQTLGNGSNIHAMIGAQTSAGAIPMLGTMDEVRISAATRSSSWYATQYNNHNATATFYTVGTQEDAPSTLIVGVDTNASILLPGGTILMPY